MNASDIQSLARVWASVAEIDAKRAELQAMIAENAIRAEQGTAIAYGETAFMQVHDDLQAIAWELRKMADENNSTTEANDG